MNKEIDFEKLRFVRIFDPVHIPIHLVEQVRDRNFSTENFYDYQKIVCLSQTAQGTILNPLNLLYVIVNENNQVKGFLWAVVSPLSRDLVINTFSMDKEYWGKGKAVQLLERKIKEIIKETKLNKVFWITNYPKHSERYGFRRSKSILMEYQEEEENGTNIPGIRCETSGNSTISESSTESLSEQHA